LAYLRNGRGWGPHGSERWEGLAVCYPTAWLIPRILRFLNGLLMAISVLPAWLNQWRNSPDVVFATWAFPDGVAAVSLARLFRVPVYLKVHGTDVVHLQGRQSLRRMLTIRALSRATGVIAVSDYLRNQLIVCGVPAERITTVYNGMDRQAFHPLQASVCRRKLGLGEEGRIGIFVGNLVPVKGVIDLVEALTPELCQQFGLQFYFIGAGPLGESLKEQVAVAGMMSSVHFVGQVEHADLADWMGAADFLCLPSHHEGLPNVVLEALACGLPVVASDVGGTPEIVNASNGRLVPPKDPVALANGISEVVQQDFDRAAVSATVNVSSWHDNAAALVRLFGGGSSS
jgi:glycosyltransferase involved in cell wall biosynthesis